MRPPLTVFPVRLDGEVRHKDDLARLICQACTAQGLALRDDDVLVITHKIVSKAEGRIARMPEDDLEARDALIQKQGVTVMRRRNGLVITRTAHGFVCASAGIDASNVEAGTVTLLPRDPDRSARSIRSRLASIAGVDVAVIISDTFGRAWRIGQTNVAIGLAGMLPTKNYKDTRDSFGALLKVTNIAVADELAGAAELVMGKADGIPVAVVRGSGAIRGRGSARQLLRAPQQDLFL